METPLEGLGNRFDSESSFNLNLEQGTDTPEVFVANGRGG
jgi:hypothetical protein